MVDYTLTLIETPESGVEGINFSCADVDFTIKVLEIARNYFPKHRLIQKVDAEQLHTGVSIVFEKDKKGKIAKKSTGFIIKAIKEVLDAPSEGNISNEV